jgi:hypothetical protein
VIATASCWNEMQRYKSLISLDFVRGKLSLLELP